MHLIPILDALFKNIYVTILLRYGILYATIIIPIKNNCVVIRTKGLFHISAQSWTCQDTEKDSTQYDAGNGKRQSYYFSRVFPSILVNCFRLFCIFINVIFKYFEEWNRPQALNRKYSKIFSARAESNKTNIEAR